VGPLRFELKSLAPQARRIPSYPTGPRKIFSDLSVHPRKP
jgi:hypothetical protein